MRTLHCGLLLTQPRGVPLGVLNGARDSRRRQLLVALRLLLSKHQRRLRLVDLCLVGADLGLLHNDLRIDILDVGPCGGYLSLSLGKRIAVIAVVDPRDHLAGDDVLVVGDRDRRQVTGHFGGDGELTRGDEGVVRRFEVRGVVPIDVARRQQPQRGGSGRRRTQTGAAAACPCGARHGDRHHRARHADLRVQARTPQLGGHWGHNCWGPAVAARPYWCSRRPAGDHRPDPETSIGLTATVENQEPILRVDLLSLRSLRASADQNVTRCAAQKMERCDEERTG